MVNPGEPLTVKLCGNRRLYEPGNARDLTLSDLQARVREGIAVIVRDAASSADITDQVLSPRRTEH